MIKFLTLIIILIQISFSQNIQCWGNNNEGQLNSPDGNFISISAGDFNACAIDENNQVHCWGSNFNGASTPPSEFFSMISSGSYHTCGILESGQTQCWGYNEYGQTDAPDEVFITLGAGYLHTCGLKANGEVECWGYNGNGESTPPEDELFTAISAGYSHTCGLKANGEVECWGYVSDDIPSGTFISINTGENGICGLRKSGVVECWGEILFPSDSPSGIFTSIGTAVNGHHKCAIDEVSMLHCWGPENSGQEIIPPNDSFIMVDVGVEHSCAITGLDNPDYDYDSILDSEDNCVLISNADQANDDADQFGNVCDDWPDCYDTGENPYDECGVCDGDGTSCGECVDFTGFEFGDCEMILGIGWADSQCQTISGCNFGEDDLFEELFFDTIEECEEACGVLGDVNQDDSLDVLDIIMVISHIIGTAELQGHQLNLADFNSDEAIDVLDIVGLMNQILT